MAGIIKDGKTYASVNPSEYVSKSSIAKTIDKNSTNEEVAGAKSVNDIMISQKVNMGTYSGDLNDIPYIDNNKVFIYKVWQAETTNKPVNTHGTVYNTWYDSALKYNTQLFIGIYGVMYIRNKNNGTWSDWRKICTTSVSDVSITDISSKLKNSTGKMLYSVKNGICRVQLLGIKPSSLVADILDTGILPNPDPTHNGHFNVIYTTGTTALFVIYNGTDIGVRLNTHASSITGDIYETLQYPVKES